VLIGRNVELDTCLGAIADTRALAVVGEAGIGKTALITEAASRSNREVVAGQGLRTLSWASYLPLETALRSSLPGGEHAAIAWAVERRIGHGLLIVDDLQWADPDTVQVVRLLAKRVPVLVAIRTDDAASAATKASLEDAGFEFLTVSSLSHPASVELVRAKRPELSVVAIDETVRLAQGNPLLLEELSRGGRPSRTLEISIAARLQQLSPSARRALGVLALLGRPGDRALAGPGLRELGSSGLVERGDGGYAPRHALIAEAAADLLTEDQRRRIHRSIASKSTNLGEAAAHHLAAGELAQARRQALDAAGRAEHVGERARLLLIATEAGNGGAEDDQLRLRAADLLVEAADHENAYRVASQIRSKDPEMVAESLLYRARALRGTEGLGPSHALALKGLELVQGSGTRLETRLMLEDVDFWQWSWDPVQAVPRARAAYEQARNTPEEVSAAVALGAALVQLGSAEGPPILREALDGARRVGDIRSEFDAAFHLCASLGRSGGWREALSLAAETRVRAIGAGLRTKEILFAFLEVIGLIDWAVDLERAIRIGLELLHEPGVPVRLVQDIAGVVAVALFEAGRIDDARDLLEETAPTGPQESVAPALAWADIELASGRPERTIEIVDEAIARFPTDANLPILWSSRAWACLELGRDSGRFERPVHPWTKGYLFEHEGIDALGRREFPRAERCFTEAARGLENQEMRAVLRCAWAAGEAAARAGDVQRARQRLVAVEARAGGHQMTRIVAMSRASLRALGVRRASSRSGTHGHLTAREREVLGLVAKGLRSREIATRLSIAPSSVEAMVRSARTKLDARTRIEAVERSAAILAAER
jgi:DNA-binding CsgD family transcriptional regulator/tetratricopeptide (TPR) repeat protein